MQAHGQFEEDAQAEYISSVLQEQRELALERSQAKGITRRTLIEQHGYASAIGAGIRSL